MNEPRILPGCSVLPPMTDDDREATNGQAEKAKGTPARRTASERFGVLNAFVDFTLAGLTRNELAVWLILFRDSRDGIARTSQADLARRAGVSDRTVRNALASLKAKGLLRVTYRGGIGRGASAYAVRSLPPD